MEDLQGESLNSGHMRGAGPLAVGAGPLVMGGGVTRYEGVVTLAQGSCLGKPAQASLRTKPCGWLVVVG